MMKGKILSQWIILGSNARSLRRRVVTTPIKQKRDDKGREENPERQKKIENSNPKIKIRKSKKIRKSRTPIRKSKKI